MARCFKNGFNTVNVAKIMIVLLLITSILHLLGIGDYINLSSKDTEKKSEKLVGIHSDSIMLQDDITQVTNGMTSQSDLRVLGLLRRKYIYGPSKGPLNLTQKNKHMDDFSQIGQSLVVDGLLKEKSGGFFIECGAATGEFLSNTLYFEKKRNWSGLLIEGNPTFFNDILQKKRNAYAVNAVLCAGNATTAYSFYLNREYGGIDKKYSFTRNTVIVQCFHLYSILLAIGQTKIDYLSLDIEGPELEVLQTLPFDKVYIDVITLEYGNKSQKKKKLIDLLTSNGFKLVRDIRTQDLVFQHL